MDASEEKKIQPAIRRPRAYWLTLAALIAASVFVKWNIWQLTPQVFNDSPGYMVPALNLLAGRGYGVQQDAFRPPTYPILLAVLLAPFDRVSFDACRDAHRAVCIGKAQGTESGAAAMRSVVFAQMIIGLVALVLLYDLGWTLSWSLIVAFLFGAGYGLNIATAFWEISILTETLTAAFLILSVYLTIKAETSIPGKYALGITLAALALCQPLFLLYWIVPCTFLFAHALQRYGGQRLKQAVGDIAPAVIVPLVLILAWSISNFFVNRSFTPSTLSGYVLMQMVAPMLEDASPENKDIAAIYIRYRDDRIANTGSDSGAIFQAWPEMLDKTGMTWSELSRRLTLMGIQLIARDPEQYFTVVGKSWTRFWDFAFYHYDPVPTGAAETIEWFTSPALQQVLDWCFWLTLPMIGFIYWIRRGEAFSNNGRLNYWGILLVIATVWYAALVVSLVNYGDNARYRSYVLAFQYGAIVWTIWALIGTIRTFFTKKDRANADG